MKEDWSNVLGKNDFSKIEERRLVSVIVPIYNAASYLPQCLESICNQNYANLEIILVDDGSTDQSGRICDNYAMKDERIVVIHQKNAGLVVARKRGLEKAKGEYIGFVDADDYIEEDMFLSLLEKIGDADFIHSSYYENNRKKEIQLSGMVDFSDGKTAFLETAVLGKSAYISPSIWSKLFRADFIKKCYAKVPNECSFGEDLLCLCICILESRKCILLDEAYYHYRVISGSMSHQKGITNIRNYITLYDGFEKVLSSYPEYNQIKDTLKNWFWRNLFGTLKAEELQSFRIQNYYFDDVEMIQGKRIVIYGAGVVGQDYYAQISRYTNCRIVAWVDQKPEQYKFEYIQLYGKDVLRELQYDILIIAIMKKEIADTVREQLLSEGVEADQIYWNPPKQYEE